MKIALLNYPRCHIFVVSPWLINPPEINLNGYNYSFRFGEAESIEQCQNSYFLNNGRRFDDSLNKAPHANIEPPPVFVFRSQFQRPKGLYI